MLISKMLLRKRVFSLASLFLLGLALRVSAPAKTSGPEFYGELEPRLYTVPELMTPAVFSPISVAQARQLDIAAHAANQLYSGQFTLPGSGKNRNIYKAVVVLTPGAGDVLYVDMNGNGRFDANERVWFRPVTNPAFPRLKEMASFHVNLRGPGIFHSCPMEVAIVGDGAPAAANAGSIDVEYTSAAFVRGFAILPDRRLYVRFEYDFAAGDVSLKHGREWLDLNNDGKFDMSAGSPESLRANGSAPVFHVGTLALQLKSVDLRRDQFVFQAVGAGIHQRRRLSLPFLGHAR